MGHIVEVDPSVTAYANHPRLTGTVATSTATIAD